MSSPRQFAPGIYLVADTALAAPRGLVEVIAAAVEAGVGMIQLREKTMSARDLLALTRATSAVTAGKATLVIDDRVDVFLAARAEGISVDGVHVGQSDLPVNLVRELVGPAAVVGLTANTDLHLTAVSALAPGTVDYLGVGAIRPTRTKPDHPEPLGVDGFARFTAASALPCVAIGGVTVHDAGDLVAAGAAGLAVVSAICSADDPLQASRELVSAWNNPKVSE